MGTVYSKVDTTTGLRVRCDYTVSYTTTNATISINLALQHKGSAKSFALTEYGGLNKKELYVDTHIGHTEGVSSVTAHSDWATVKSKSLSQTLSKSTSQYTVTYEVGFGYDMSLLNSNTFSVNIPALTSYNVTYSANGGSGAPSTQKKYYERALTLSTVKPTRTGYVFWHWNTNTSNTGTAYSPGGNYTANAALALHAIWNPIIYFNANGGTISSAGLSQLTKTYGQEATVYQTKPSRQGYRFARWNTKADGTGTSYQPLGTIAASMNTTMTLYAIWETMPTAPKIASMTAERCDSQGNSLDDGSYCKVTVQWSVDTTSQAYPNNSGTVTGTIKPENGSATSFTFSSGASGSGDTAIALISNLNTDVQYVVSATVTDAVTSASRNVILTRAFFIMDFKAGGVGLGIGRAAPDNGLEIGYETTFDEDVNFLADVSVSNPANFRSAIGAQQTLSVSSNINIASYIASSTGAFVSGTVRTYGKVCMLRIVFKNTGTVGKNGVVYAATISSYKPVQQVIGVGSNGGNPVVCSIDANGNISARNCGASATFTDTAIAITYLLA